MVDTVVHILWAIVGSGMLLLVGGGALLWFISEGRPRRQEVYRVEKHDVVMKGSDVLTHSRNCRECRKGIH